MSDDFQKFLDRASETVAGWPVWKKEVLGRQRSPEKFAKELQGTWDLGGEDMAKSLTEELNERAEVTRRILDMRPSRANEVDILKNQQVILAALIHLVGRTDRVGG
jgi:hypothetical protein